MLFNSISFAIFLPIVFILYWFIFKKTSKAQNFLLLVSSYFFYSCWDWRFLFLLVFSTLLDFFTGQKIQNVSNEKIRKFWFWTSILVNLGLLVVFKYFNFFSENFGLLLNQFGLETDQVTLDIVLPVGISFYTFHGVSYVVDIYNRRIKSENNFIDYAVFVSYFPLLVAGPIERATHLLPQLKVTRAFNYSKAVDGMRQILWGLFKKVVIADQCAEFVDLIHKSPDSLSGSTLLLGAILFTIQIYGDFSGYSDIALGASRLFGIELLRNFAYPFFSRDIAEFWRRWHISLSSWFKDYLYIPLGGSKGSMMRTFRNTFIVFLTSGFWHGATWNFIIWGLVNAIYILPSIYFETNRKYMDIVARGKLFPTMKEFSSMILTFFLTAFAFIFFRAADLKHAWIYVKNIFSSSLFTIPEVRPSILLSLVVIFMGVEWLGREHNYALAKVNTFKNPIVRALIYLSIALLVFIYQGKKQTFIYFQF